MKIQDIVTQLKVNLPRFTDLVTTNFSVTSLTRSGTTVTATTSGVHGLVPGKSANIVGAQTPLNVVSLTRVGVIGFIETSEDTDFTEGLATPTITLIDANEANFNGTFNIVGVTNRRNIQFTMVDSGATTATGTPLVVNGTSALQQYNGLKEVTVVPTTTTFEYEISDSTLFTPASGTITAKTDPRVTGALDLDAIEAAYTKQGVNDVYLFVTLGDVVASKDRNNLSDATSNIQRSEFFRQQIIQNTTLYVVIPTAEQQIAARPARDTAEDLFRPICQSILFSKFDTGLFTNDNALQFIGHATASYNKAYLVHAYSFEQVADLNFADTVGYDEDVAFRDINLNMTPGIGTQNEVITTTINLDEEALP